MRTVKSVLIVTRMGYVAVSYTHLDVYKRQLANYPIWTINRGRMENGERTETTWEYNALSKPMVVHINKSDLSLIHI